MRITHNISALNTYRHFNRNSNALSSGLEKLSSGYRINRAGDDAAGLAISEKMRIQIAGLRIAQRNAKDGINLIQTAEGALTEVHDILNRMYGLAEQSANGTYDDKTDRPQLQEELEALRAEIDRIAETANFNGINLLDGTAGAPKVTSTAVNGAKRTVAGVAAVYSGAISVSKRGSVGAAAQYAANVTLSQTGKRGAKDTWLATARWELRDEQPDKYFICFNGSVVGQTTGNSFYNGYSNGTYTEEEYYRHIDDNVQNTWLPVQLKDANAKLYYTPVITKTGDRTFSITITANVEGQVGGTRTGVPTVAAQEAVKKAYTAFGYGEEIPGNISPTQSIEGVDPADWEFTVGSNTYTVLYDETSVNSQESALSALQSQLEGFSALSGYTVSIDPETMKVTVTAASEGPDAGASSVTALGFTQTVEGRISENGEIKVNGSAISVSPGANNAEVLNNYIASVISPALGSDWTASVNAAGDGILFTAKTPGAIGRSGPADLSALSAYGVTADTVPDVEGSDAYTEYTAAEISISFSGALGRDLIGSSIRIGSNTYEFVGTGAGAGGGNIAVALDGSEDANAVAVRLKTALEANDAALAGAFTGTVRNGVYTLTETSTGTSVINAGTGAERKIALYSGTLAAPEVALSIVGSGIRLQIGENADSHNQISVRISDMHTAAMTGDNSNGMSLADIDISRQSDAVNALSIIHDAIDYVSGVRGNLGALQNRLEHTINNLAVTQENIEAAESVVRDTDIAEEMAAHAKLSILMQSSQAMLAQANQSPQGVLLLLT